MMKNSCVQLKVSCLLQSSAIHLDLNILSQSLFISLTYLIALPIEHSVEF